MQYPFIPYKKEALTSEQCLEKSKSFYTWLNQRRSVREFKNTPIDKAVIENIILSAGTAPSGAHKQPWTFCAVSNPELKTKIRLAAEEEEKESYTNRMSEEWLNDLAPLGTDWQKPFLETAPWLIVVFRKSYEMVNESKKLTYYSQESIGIACGILLTAIHNAGLGALTHTPSPMNFLTQLLNRPANEKPFLLIPVGYVADNCTVPDLTRKPINEIALFYE